MKKDDRRKQLEHIFENVDEAEKILIANMLDKVIYLESRMETLETMPQIEVHPENPQKMRQTAAAKQYKECSQSYANYIRILLNVLRKTDTDAAADLMKRLEEFA